MRRLLLLFHIPIFVLTLSMAAPRASAATEGTATVLPDPGWAELVQPDAEFSAMRWSNGEVTLNDRCPVRKVKLNPSMPPIYVNGEPIGFC